MELTTERLVLREFAADDVEAVQDYASDPEVCRYVEWGPNSVDATRAFLALAMQESVAEPRETFTFAVTEAGRLLGAAALVVVSHAHQRGSLGYVLRRDTWGRGLATESARALIRFGFEELGLHRIEATCDPRNAGSARVLEKAGMTQEGRIRDHMLVRAEWRDSLLFAVLRR